MHARRWCAGEWRSIDEVAAREVSLRILYGGGETRLWAWPHECAELAAGHVLLDCLHDADCPSPRGISPVEVLERVDSWYVTLSPLDTVSRMKCFIVSIWEGYPQLWLLSEVIGFSQWIYFLPGI